MAAERPAARSHRYVKVHVPHAALFIASSRIVTLTVWGRTLIHWRAAS